MKKSFLRMSTSLRSTLICGAAVFAFASCSDKEVNEPEITPVPTPEEVAAPATSLTVTTDKAYLNGFVTNYAKAYSRSIVSDGVMPVECPEIPEAAVEYGTIKFYWFADEAAKEAALTSKVTVPTEAGLSILGDMTIYVASEFTIVGANSANGGFGDVTIYVLPGGSLKFKGNWSNGLPFHVDNSTLTIYNFGDMVAAQDASVACNIENVTIHSKTPIDIENLGIGTGSKVYAYGGIDCAILNIYVDAELWSGCNTFATEKIIIDSRSELSTGYVKTPKMIIKGNDQIADQCLVLRNGGIWESNDIELDNVQNIRIASDTDDNALIKARIISANGIELEKTFHNLYICAEAWGGDNRLAAAEDVTEVATFDKSVQVIENADAQIVEDDSTCSAKVFVPENPDPGISDVEIDHKHPISATGIDVDANGNIFVSWHSRGGNIHGCIEWLQLKADAGVVTTDFKAWMETPMWKYGGSLDSDEASMAFDFNHIIYDSANNCLLTVGDHAKKGGFIGRINLSAIQEGVYEQELNIMDVRQLFFPKSGNAVAKVGDQLFIACAGGFNTFNYSADFTTVKVSDCKAVATNGSAKHVAVSPNGLYTATIEYDEQPADPKLWWNDFTTTIPATIKVWNTNAWLSTVVATYEVEAYGPVYGKSVIAVENDGTVYSCQGVNGVVKYSNGTATKFNFKDSGVKLTDEERISANGSAANGLCVDGDNLFIAYGGAGIWAIDKNDMATVKFYHITVDKFHSEAEGKEIGASANYVKVADFNGGKYLITAYGLGGVNVKDVTDLY